jgi:hypothetical protein
LIRKIIFLFFSTYGIWASLDGLYINYYNQEITTADIAEVERNSSSSARYMAIKNGYWSSGYVYSLQKDSNKVLWIYSGLLSKEQQERKSPIVSVVVKEDVDIYKHELSKWYSKNKANKAGVVSGVTRIGWDSLGSEEKELLKSLGYKLNENFIFVERNSKPREVWINVSILVVSLAIFLLVIFNIYIFVRNLKRPSNVK